MTQEGFESRAQGIINRGSAHPAQPAAAPSAFESRAQGIINRGIVPARGCLILPCNWLQVSVTVSKVSICVVNRDCLLVLLYIYPSASSFLDYSLA